MMRNAQYINGLLTYLLTYCQLSFTAHGLLYQTQWSTVKKEDTIKHRTRAQLLPIWPCDVAYAPYIALENYL